MKYPIITVTALNLLFAAAMPVMADYSDDHSGVDRGEEINARLDQQCLHLLLWLKKTCGMSDYAAVFCVKSSHVDEAKQNNFFLGTL